jgi:methionine-rich copper-binding protein CopC
MHRSWSLAAWAAVAPLLAASLALAHAVVTKATLDDTPVRADTATAVTLHFNSRIEPGFTRVVLVDGAGKERPLEVAPGSDPGKVTVSLPPLAAGAYGLRYKVLDADGHVTESLLRFRVTPAE